MRLLRLAIGCCAALVCATAVQSRAESVHPVNLSLFHPIATNRSPDVLTHFRLNLFYGRVHDVHGVDLSGAVARIDGNLYGGQAVAGYSHIGGNMVGVTFNPFGVSYVGGNAWGVQYSGLVTFNRGDMIGLSNSLLFNFTGGEVRGFQAASLFNLANHDARWLQIAATCNVAVNSFSGLQLAGLNFIGEELYGVQLGGVDVATRLHGVQAGGINMAGTSTGFQFGVINYATDGDGAQVGLLDINVRDGHESWVSFASGYAGINSGVRTQVSGVSSMLTVGAGDLEADESETYFLSWHIGYLLGLYRGLGLLADGGVVAPLRPEELPSQIALQARLMLEHRFALHFSVFGGGGWNKKWTEVPGTDSSTSATTSIWSFGIAVF